MVEWRWRDERRDQRRDAAENNRRKEVRKREKHEYLCTVKMKDSP